MADVIFSIPSRFAKTIRLTETIWGKIQRSHPEFQVSPSYVDQIQATVGDPDYVVRGWTSEYLALRWCEGAPAGAKHLCVVYRELDDEGFVVTAFFISRYERLLRREVLWRRN